MAVSAVNPWRIAFCEARPHQSEQGRRNVSVGIGDVTLEAGAQAGIIPRNQSGLKNVDFAKRGKALHLLCLISGCDNDFDIVPDLIKCDTPLGPFG
jgi:hypothetical protein